jgi:hypothetical protein
VSSSFNRDYFDLKEDDSIKDYEWLSSKVRVEKNFNEDKELDIDDEIFSFLFYDKKLDWHRFDKNVSINDTLVIGTKTINKIYDESTKETIDIDKINKDIYLFFLATDEWAYNVIPKERGRLKLKIEWK